MKLELAHCLKPLYEKLLIDTESFGKQYPFCLQWGKKFPEESNKGILFIGKATNGWQFPTNDINEIFPEHGEGIFDVNDQMQWVQDKINHSDSAFWRVIKKVCEEIYNPSNWYSYVAWSNLYKISPERGNPSLKLRSSQKNTCVEILKSEIEILSPQYIIFLTSNWEQPFLKSILEDNNKGWRKVNWDKYFFEYKKHNKITYVKTKYPQNKPEEPHVKALFKILNVI